MTGNGTICYFRSAANLDNMRISSYYLSRNLSITAKHVSEIFAVSGIMKLRAAFSFCESIWGFCPLPRKCCTFWYYNLLDFTLLARRVPLWGKKRLEKVFRFSNWAATCWFGICVDYNAQKNVWQEAHQLVGWAKGRATKTRLEAVRGGIFDSFFRDNSRPEVIGHVISDVAAG